MSIAQETADESNTGRIEAFSDGVFAVAITLLVLDIHVPTEQAINSANGLWSALLLAWPNYLAYVISFGIILVMWSAHHAIFGMVRRVDQGLLLLNGLLLMMIVLVPFPTALVSAQIRGTQSSAAVAVAVYGGLSTLVAVFYNVLWWYASRHPALIYRDRMAQYNRGVIRRYAAGPLCYLAGTLLAFVSIPTSIIIFMVMTIFYALPNTRPSKGSGEIATK